MLLIKFWLIAHWFVDKVKCYTGRVCFLDNLCDTYGETLNVYDPVKKMLSKEINDKLKILDDSIPTADWWSTK